MLAAEAGPRLVSQPGVSSVGVRILWDLEVLLVALSLKVGLTLSLRESRLRLFEELVWQVSVDEPS